MNNKDLISQYVDTGLRIPEHQVVQLPNWAKKTYIRKRLLSIKANEHANLHYYEIMLLPSEEQAEYVYNANDDQIDFLRNNNRDRLGVFNLILKHRGDNMTKKDVYKILSTIPRAYDSSTVPDIIGKENINKLDGSYVSAILSDAIDVDKMANILGKENINKLGNYFTLNLIYNAPDRERMINIILKYNGDILTDTNVKALIKYSDDKERIRNIISKYRTHEQ